MLAVRRTRPVLRLLHRKQDKGQITVDTFLVIDHILKVMIIDVMIDFSHSHRASVPLTILRALHQSCVYLLGHSQ